MNNSLSISMFEVVGSPLCVASGDGQKVYKRLYNALANEQPVSLSFHNVSTLTSAFLNVAVGQLYGQFDENHIRRMLQVTDIESDDAELLKRVVESAKLYFQNPKIYKQAIEEELGK